jgi:hypothetical protein
MYGLDGTTIKELETGVKWKDNINIISRLALLMGMWSVFLEIWAFCKNITYMKHSQKLLINYERTKYSHR